MNEEVDMILDMADESMKAAVEHLDKELGHIRAGKASPRMLDSVTVEYYGSMTPLSQVSNVSTPDAKTIAVQPWEKQMIGPIEKAIMNANLGFNPENNGEIIRIFIPPLTEERRKSLAKEVNKEGENARISLRNARKEANDELKKLLKEGLAEDDEKAAVEEVQDLIKKYNVEVDKLVEDKQKEILTV